MTDTATPDPALDNTTEVEDTAEYQVLARKYRPRNFAELKGQDALVRTLTNAIETGRVAHAFMLTGVRGVGKTTTARILARALNCMGADGKGGATANPCGVCESCMAIASDRHVDVLEMDAASRTGIDDIREIIDSVQYAPSFARYKIYIIDEVHMLSKSAFNALLKTLEEPPEHIKFVFATTEIRKVPVTVLSRCQRFDLRRVDVDILEGYFTELAEKEGATTEKEAISLIARAADGSVRDGLSLLDQAISFDGKEISEIRVRDMLGLADRAVIFDLFEAVMQGNAKSSFDIIAGLYKSGADPLVVLQDLMEITHFLTKCKAVPDAVTDVNLPETERIRGKEMADKLLMPVLTRTWQILLKGVSEVQQSQRPQLAAEMILVRLLYAADLPAPADLVKKLQNTPTEQTAPTGSAPTPPSGNGGGAVASTGGVAAQSQAVSMPVAEEVIVETPQPTSFLDVVELFGQKKELLLQAQIKKAVHLVKFSVGHIELRLVKGSDPQLPGVMGKKLLGWTKQRWIIAISDEEGAETLASIDDKKAETKLNTVKADKTVAEVIKLFPGADIVSID